MVTGIEGKTEKAKEKEGINNNHIQKDEGSKRKDVTTITPRNKSPTR